MRDMGCPDCQQLTAGDCGKHGPLIVIAWTISGGIPPATFDPRDAELARVRRAADEAIEFWRRDATTLRVECERLQQEKDKADEGWQTSENELALEGARRQKAEDERDAVTASSIQQAEELERLTTALQRMVDWSDCQCEHDTVDCCANVPDSEFHCPGCIATTALQQAHAAEPSQETDEEKK